MPLPDAAPRAEKISRPSVPALDAMLGDPIPVLDEGFVRVVDYMGDDSAVVQAARTSYGKGTKRRHEDRGLLRYLMRHAHTTPFEMCELKLHVRVPMDVWRQWIRHRTASVNEYSTRYSEAIDAAQRTSPDAWRLQSAGNRQGSSGLLPPEQGARLSEEESQLQRQARDIYEARLAAGVAREQARKDLPLSTYTEAYWKIDLQNLLHFLELRMDEHAQQEIRAYANVIGNEIVAKWVPLTWEAFLDYRRGGTRLSRIESAFLAALASGERERAVAIAEEGGFLTPRRGRHAQAEPRGPRTRRETGAPRPSAALGIDASWAAHGGPSDRLHNPFSRRRRFTQVGKSSPLDPSTAAVADGHLVVFHDDRDVAAALAVAEHPLQAGGVLLHVDVLDRVAALCEDLTGLRRVGSGVLAEDQDVSQAPPGFGTRDSGFAVAQSRCST